MDGLPYYNLETSPSERDLLFVDLDALAVPQRPDQEPQFHDYGNSNFDISMPPTILPGSVSIQDIDRTLNYVEEVFNPAAQSSNNDQIVPFMATTATTTHQLVQAGGSSETCNAWSNSFLSPGNVRRSGGWNGFYDNENNVRLQLDRSSDYQMTCSVSQDMPTPSTGSVKSNNSIAYQKKRRHLEPHEREKVNKVRSDSACIRCQILKESCSDGTPCSRCLHISATAKIWRGPCFKGRITDVVPFRTGALSFPEGVRKIETWTSTQKVAIMLFNIGCTGRNLLMPDENRPRVQVVCQQYSPQPTDVLCKKWIRNGKTVEFELPPFALPRSQLLKAFKSLDTLVDKYWEILVSELNVGQDELVSRTLREAIRHHKKCAAIHSALRICVITRLASRSFNLTGDQTLGIVPVDDPYSPYYGRRPIPPVLDAQLDLIWMEKMSKLKKDMLSKLKTKMMGRKKEDWFYTFLTIFLLTTNLEFIYQVQNDQLRRYYLNKPSSSYPFASRSMMECWENSAENLLAHFRAVCHGFVPFSIDWEDENRPQVANIDMESVIYLIDVQRILSGRVSELQSRTADPPGSPLKWISALFLPPEITAAG